MSEPPHDPSVRYEPFYGVPAETPSTPDEPALTGRNFGTLEEPGLASAWDEPAIVAGEAAVLPGAITYATWYRRGIAETTLFRSQLAVFALALLGGPFAVSSALFFAQPQTLSGAFAAVVLAPVIEEMLKIGAVLILLERRPYLIVSGVQLFVAALCSALCFAAIENLLYLYVYIAQPSPALVLWRWTICVGMHTSATGLASLGLWRMWSISRATLTRPDTAIAAPMLALAMCLHGGYNFFALQIDSWFR